MQENTFSTEFNDHTLTYVAGYVERKILTKIDCAECYSLLKKKSVQSYATSPLIDLKDLGGLHRPCIAIDQIVHECDKYFNFYRNNNNIFKQKNILLRLVSAVQQIILEKRPKIFEEFDQHSKCFIEGSHRMKLIKKICELFLSLRCKHLAREEKEKIGVKKVRRVMTKLILFNGN